MAVQARTQPRTPIIPNQSRTAIVNNGMSFAGAEIVTVLKSIQSSVLQIESIVSNTLVLQKKQDDTDRKNKEKQERAKKENRLEQKKAVNPVAFLKDSLPRMGLIDTIRNFILYTFMGFAVPKLIKFLPQVLRIVQFIDPFIKLTENFAGAVFNNLIKTIDFSYAAYDKVKGVVKSIGGENFEKQFENLSSGLNTFLNTAIIVGLAIAGSGELGGGGARGRGFTGGGRGGGEGGVNTRLGQYLKQTKTEKFIERRYGYDASRMYKGRIEQGGTRKRALADVRSRFAPRTPAAGLVGAGRTPGAIGGRGLGRVAQRAGIKYLGKTAGRFFGRVPIIGPLLDFGISIALGEDPGRAGAGAVGAFVGGALGSLIPIPGVGTIAGSFLGDFIGRSLYDAVTTTRNQNNVEKKARGGRVSAGKPTRKAPVRKAPKKEKPISKITIPSKTPIKEIEQKFSKSQLEYFEKSNQIYQRNDRLFGPFASLSIKALKGEKPDNTTIRKMSENFGIVVDNIVQNQTRRSLFTAANGGTVPITREIKSKKTVGETFSDLMYGTAVSMFNKGVNETLQRLKGIKETSGETTPPLPPGEGVVVSSDSPDFWLLATAALFENSDPQGAADVAQAIYNRVAMPGDPWKVNNSIRTAILNPGQFQPVRQYGGRSAWDRIKDKESAIAFIKTHGKSQEQLESVSAALLNTTRQRSAKNFVGPRDSFRSVSYENANDHLADDTEVRRHGHVFGFEPRGATIASFRAGKLSPAEIATTTRGTVTYPENTSGYKPASPGYFNVIQYITGDPSHPNFELRGHGMPGNYHDHIAFRTVQDKERAKAALIAAGIRTGSEYRSGDPGYHGSNRALDVPGYQWGGTGAIGQKEYVGSAKVRAVLGIDSGVRPRATPTPPPQSQPRSPSPTRTRSSTADQLRNIRGVSQKSIEKIEKQVSSAEIKTPSGFSSQVATVSRSSDIAYAAQEITNTNLVFVTT